jgi:hypothetical protein
VNLPNINLTSEKFVEVAQSGVLLRGRLETYSRVIETHLQVFTIRDEHLIEACYRDAEPLSSPRFWMNGWEQSLDPERRAAELIDRWRGNPDCLYWPFQAQIIVVGGQGGDWSPLPAGHFHLMRHYTAVRALLAELKERGSNPRSADADQMHRRFSGLLQEQLRAWEKFSANLA